MAEPLSAIATVGGLIGGVVKLVSTVSNLKERWDYAELNITSLFSTLWAVKTALEEIAEWRSTSKDKSPRSERLDTNLALCIQGTAVLVAYMENRLKDIKLEDISKYDKAKFMNLDSLFRNLANDLGAQVRALQLLLTTYQCQTLSEQNDRLQRMDTKRVMRAARESTTGLRYVEKDIEDAASILSEAPSKSFEFDKILMQHQNYSRTYPRLYEEMQRNFPTRRSSSASIEEPVTTQRISRNVTDSVVGQTPDLPFLGVLFAGEMPATVNEVVEEEETTQSFLPAKIMHPENQQQASASEEWKKLQNLPKVAKSSGARSQKPDVLMKLKLPGRDVAVDIGSRQHVVHSAMHKQHPPEEHIPSTTKDRPSVNPDVNTLMQSPGPSRDLNFASDTQAVGTGSTASRRKTSFNSLYDDSDEEPSRESSQNTLRSLAANRYPSQSPSAGTDQIRLQSKQVPVVFKEEEKQEPFSVTTELSRSTSSKPPESSHVVGQEVVEPTNNANPSLTNEARSPPELAKVLPIPREIKDLARSGEDASVHTEGAALGDKHQVDFMSGFLNFSFDHDIDLQITPQSSSFGKQQNTNGPITDTILEDELESVKNLEASPSDVQIVTNNTTEEVSATKDESAADLVSASDNQSDRLIYTSSEEDLPQNTVADMHSSGDIEVQPSDKSASPYEGRDSNSEDDLARDLHHYTNRNDPFRSASHQEDGEPVQSLAAPRRLPPPIPHILEETEDPIVLSQQSSPNLFIPVDDHTELAAAKTPYQDDQPESRGYYGAGLRIPASPASTYSHRGTISIASMESSTTSKKSTSDETEATTITTDTSNSTRIIPDLGQHKKMQSSISQSLSQLSHHSQTHTRNRFSTFTSKLNRKAAGERVAKAQQLAHAMTAGNTSGVLFAIGTFEKAIDVSIPVALNNEKEPIPAFVRAARLGNTEYMTVLLERDPRSILWVDTTGRTVLHHAISANASLAVLWLANYLRDTDVTPLQGKGSIKVIDMKDKHGVSAVHLAARLNDIFLFETLQKANADCGARDVEGKTVLEYAIEARNFHMVQYLLKQNLIGNVNTQNAKGETALMVAARVDDGSSLGFLLDGGGNKNLRDVNGDMAIHYAARYGNLGALELLFQSIEDVTAKNTIGEQPLHLAAAGDHVHILSALLRIPGIDANVWTEPPHLRQSIKREERLAATMKLASTALHYACSAGHHQAADLLLERGARVNSNQEDGFSALMMACHAQSSAIVSLLLLHGADPKGSTSTEGMTALHIACKLNDVACTRMLLEHGANPMARLSTKSKDTPDGLGRRDRPPFQQQAADICTEFRRAIARDRWALDRSRLGSTTLTTTTTTATTTATSPNTTHPPNVRPIISPLGFPVIPTTNQSVGMPGTRQYTTNYSRGSGEPLPPLPPPPYYQA